MASKTAKGDASAAAVPASGTADFATPIAALLFEFAVTASEAKAAGPDNVPGGP
jgi:hypothetical protein